MPEQNSVLQEILDIDAAWDAAEAYWDAIDQQQWEEDLQGDKEYKNYLEQRDYYHDCPGHY
ncbi:hypothetical protein [Synechococcus sp. PCC 6312]|uniref:hypothetical protein n=1 Tax=Synechococcus sp. (strain ATCC 27167 / PCC 6312) TaxID=195253 RepID=UPI00029ED666|nr:hypothetical protein [Synechococcus sp. PCC 6312]AFY61901.1 hypothetical protein Syn6312_2826 [Synechococcus sp. PCC 6312]